MRRLHIDVHIGKRHRKEYEVVVHTEESKECFYIRDSLSVPSKTPSHGREVRLCQDAPRQSIARLALFIDILTLLGLLSLILASR